MKQVTHEMIEIFRINKLKFIKNENTELLHAERLKLKSEINSLELSLKNQIENSANMFLNKLFLRHKNV